ncbi:hypothetical protein [Bradyrhizobium liaoningense]|uniref:hypothetical protein n=1 Tax=Bradyrhizobium liaoningense TaxID=43992 RepID=UPI001BA6F7BD|nr:hypothetical protein [Bradyrhizobium liaoningense]MBR0987619.1 hypothetical protein [Bradyrhizobium liaoningense]
MNINQRNYLRKAANLVDPKRSMRNFVAHSRTRWTYRHSHLLSAGEGNQWIADAIKNRRAAAVGKIGRSELKVLSSWKRKSAYDESISEEIFYHSGVFPPTREALDDFCMQYSDACREVDLLAVWGASEEYSIVEEFCASSTLCEIEELEPYYHEKPWSAELKGLNVLVISPFVDSIARQFQAKQEIWSQYPAVILPEFNLKLLKAHHSEALQPTGYPNWSAMCDDAIRQASKIEFDVAIVGFGAASLPICSALKSEGKFAIHLGGAVQILFGLLGARWDQNPKIATFVNSHWSRPAGQERPLNSQRIERGAYW